MVTSTLPEITLSLAISEPGTGAHPKYLQTSASREGDDWVLTGEKSFLTNGPLAALFVVLAVSATEGDKKRLTAFLVPRETPGLSLTDPIHLDFLKPSPHCGIRLDACRLFPIRFWVNGMPLSSRSPNRSGNWKM